MIVEWDEVGANKDYKLELIIGNGLYSGCKTVYFMEDINDKLEDIHGNKIVAIYKVKHRAGSLDGLLDIYRKDENLECIWKRYK